MYRGYEHADVQPDVMDGDRLSLSPRYPPPDLTTAEAVVPYRLLRVSSCMVCLRGSAMALPNVPLNYVAARSSSMSPGNEKPPTLCSVGGFEVPSRIELL